MLVILNVLNEGKKLKSKKQICVTYWINKLQNLQTKQPILVTLNPPLRKKLKKKNT